MGFCENHNVDVVGFHMVDDSVDFGWFPKACDIPLTYSYFVALGEFDVMSVLVSGRVWLLDVGFEPVGSCGLCGVLVLGRGMVGAWDCGGLGRWDVELSGGVWAMLEFQSGL